MGTQKTEHKVGERLYLSKITGSFYIDAIKTPWTVIESKPSSITIQRAREIYNGPRYYDTLPDDIQEDPNGETIKLIWSKAREAWVESNGGRHPRYAFFGQWESFPYLD